jgi:dipeptidyl aminopeptidase/acylaminoacyl peptidase
MGPVPSRGYAYQTNSGPFFDVTPEGHLVLPIGQREGGSDLFEFTMDGDTVARITNSPSVYKGFPAVSPDGRAVAFDLSEDTSVQVWVVNRDGTGAHRLVPTRFQLTALDSFPRASTTIAGSEVVSQGWSPDGAFVLVMWAIDPSHVPQGYYTDPGEIYAIRVKDGRAVRLTRWPYGDDQAVMRRLPS